MSNVVLHYDGSLAAGGTLPLGSRVGRIKKAEARKSKTSGNPMLVVHVDLGKPFAPVVGYVLFNKDQMWQVRQFLSAVGGYDLEGNYTLDPRQLFGKEVGMQLEKDEYNGRPQARVRKWISVSEISPTDDANDEIPMDYPSVENSPVEDTAAPAEPPVVETPAPEAEPVKTETDDNSDDDDPIGKMLPKNNSRRRKLKDVGVVKDEDKDADLDALFQ